MKKIISLIFCCLIFVFIPVSVFATVPESADESGLSTIYINVVDASTTFKISNTGKATVRDSYSGKVGKFKSATVSTKVQKKVGVIWVTVNGASWKTSSSSVDYSKAHSVQLSNKGTYRAYSEFKLYNVDGSDEEITKNVEKTY